MIRHRLKKHEVRWAFLGVALLFLVGLLLCVWSDSLDTQIGSKTDERVDREGGDSGEADASRSEILAEDKIKAKVRSLLNVRKGEVAMIRIPNVDLERFSSPTTATAQGDGAPVAIVGLYSRGQLTPILEDLLRDGQRIKGAVGTGKGMKVIGRNLFLELSDLNDAGEVSDLSFNYGNSNGAGLGQTAVSVFNGYGALMYSNQNGYPEGVLILTGRDPDKEE